MKGTRLRWLLAFAIVAGLLVVPAAWGAPGQEQSPAPAPPAAAPESIHLLLKANGVKIDGGSVIPGKGGASSIEVLGLEHAVITPREAGSGQATGRRQYQPLLIRKRIDKASPLLMKALTNNQSIEASIQFFRPDVAGKGVMEQYYTIQITGGQILDYKLYSTTGQPTPVGEEFTLSFQKITWTYNIGGVTHEDSWQR